MSNWGPIVENLGLYAAAGSAIVSALVIAYKKGIKPMFQAVRKYNELCDKIAVIYDEVRPNGGTSIKDTIGRMEIDLGKVNERQKAILADSSDAYFETDSKGNYLWVNRTYCRVTHRIPSELMGNGWENAISEDDRERVIKAWDTALDEQREFNMSFNFETPDGKKKLAKVRTYRMEDSKGDVIGYLGSIALPETSSV